MKKISFNQKCYTLLKRVPRGKVTTYKAIANALQCRAYRAVGNAMRTNPSIPIVPCHRVVNSDGSIGGYASGTDRKIQMLKAEGVVVKENKVVDFDNKLYEFI